MAHAANDGLTKTVKPDALRKAAKLQAKLRLDRPNGDGFLVDKFAIDKNTGVWITIR